MLLIGTWVRSSKVYVSGQGRNVTLAPKHTIWVNTMMCCSDIQFTISAKKAVKNSTPNWFYSLFCDPRSPVFALILTFSHANAPILHATATHIIYRELGLWRQLTIVEKLRHPDSVVCPSATFAGSFAQYTSSLAQHFGCVLVAWWAASNDVTGSSEKERERERER